MANAPQHHWLNGIIQVRKAITVSFPPLSHHLGSHLLIQESAKFFQPKV
uniref:Uncharacterized protein n=1 Tax=Megaselia scalaris TaxID=36166 RepID=T1GCE4_MEGSC